MTVAPDGASSSTPEEAAGLARLALAFQHRIDRLPEAADASWQAISDMQPVLVELSDGAARRRLMLRLFRSWCGPLPGLQDLATPAGRLALQGRLAMLSRLCAVALVSRPGVIRCCIERRARQALEGALGPAIEWLRESAHDGPAVPAHVAAWVPIQWACVGYADLSRIDAWPHRSLRRLARLALPVKWPVPTSAQAMPPLHVSTREALQRMETFFEKEAAW